MDPLPTGRNNTLRIHNILTFLFSAGLGGFFTTVGIIIFSAATGCSVKYEEEKVIGADCRPIAEEVGDRPVVEEVGDRPVVEEVEDSLIKGRWLGVFRRVKNESTSLENELVSNSDTEIGYEDLDIKEKKKSGLYFIEGSSIFQNNQGVLSGYSVGKLINFAYTAKRLSEGTGNVFLQKQRGDLIYLGYWEGKSCEIPRVIRCPYVLAKNDDNLKNVNNITEMYDDHLNKSCQIVSFKNSVSLSSSCN